MDALGGSSSFSEVNPFFSFTSNVFPSSQAISRQAKLPLGVVVHPLLDGVTVPQVTYGTEPLVRCHNCNGYISPFTTFSQAGRVWHCNLCRSVNRVPEYFYAPTGNDGKRTDIETRTELNALAYDILAPEDYMQRPPMPPTFCFVLDISQAARRIGMVETVCEVVEGLVAQKAFPGLPRTQVAFILYGHEVHLIGFSETGPIQMFSVSRAMGEPFLPVPKDQLLVSVADNEAAIQQCMQVIRRMSAQSCAESSALRSALLYAKLVLESSGGKMMVFVGESNTEDAVQPMIEIGVNPATSFYRELAIGLTSSTITCDAFISATRYCSLYSIGELAKFTSGKVFFYPEMRPMQQHKLMNELWLDITRETVWETGLRVRVNLDWKMVQVYGHYHIRTSDLLSLPTLDSTQTITYDLDLDVAVASNPYLYLQSALLFSTSEGDRRIRVINKRVLLSDNFQEMYKSADSLVVASVLAKRALFRMCQLSRFEAGKGYLEEQLSEIYSVYEPLKDTINDPLQFLPSLTLGLIKLPLFNGLTTGCKCYK